MVKGESEMYYLLNHIFILFLTIAIGLIYTKEASSGFVLVFLLIAATANLFASAYATSKYSKLEDRIEELENRKEDK